MPGNTRHHASGLHDWPPGLVYTQQAYYKFMWEEQGDVFWMDGGAPADWNIPQITLNARNLEVTNTYKYLGYIIDNKPEFGDLFVALLNRLNNTLRIFKLIRPSLTLWAAVMVFKAKFLSLLDYASLYMIFVSKQKIRKLHFNSECLY